MPHKKQAGCYTMFETAMGVCGIAWTDTGITRLQLPEKDAQATEGQMTGYERCQVAPAWVREAVDRIKEHLETGRGDLTSIPLDMRNISPFFRKVYEAARKIKPGAAMTYGELASICGSGGAARAVGQAMARNPFALIVPCHRVLSSGGKIGGFSAHGGTQTKRRLLTCEGFTGQKATGRKTPKKKPEKNTTEGLLLWL